MIYFLFTQFEYEIILYVFLRFTCINFNHLHFIQKGQVPARLVLYLLSWSGFLVSFMMRTDINLAIVAMVEEPQVEKSNSTEDFCFPFDDTYENETKEVSLMQLETLILNFLLQFF